MTELATGLALVLVLEGIIWALFPDGMKRAAAAALEMASSTLRVGGLVAACVGIAVIWLIRG